MNNHAGMNKKRLITAMIGMLLFGAPVLFRTGIIYAVTEAAGIGIFLYLVQTVATKKELLVEAVLVTVANILRYQGLAGIELLDILLLGIFGLILYLIMMISGYLSERIDSFFSTLFFPTIWQLALGLFGMLRIPIMMRTDMMFYDIRPLIQSETVIMGYGLNFLILWCISLVVYSVQKKRRSGVITAVCIFTALFAVGEYRILTQPDPVSYLKVAYTTGPYMGDFINYTDMELERDKESLRSSVAQAAEKEARILVFNEEAFTIADHEEEGFLLLAEDLAKTYDLHILLGLEVLDTDQSQNGLAFNKIVWIDSEGDIAGEYSKHNTIPILEAEYIRGDGSIPVLDLEIDGEAYKIAYAICYDSTFQMYLNQIREKADFLFLPSWDWEGITDIHYRVCGTDAVALRMTVLKPTYDGYTIAADPYGKILALTHTKDTGYEQVGIVELPKYAFDNQGMEAVPTESGWKYAILGAEITSLLLLLIILYANYFEIKNHSKRRNSFGLLIIADIIAMLADGISWTTDGRASLSWLNFTATTIGIAMTFVIAGLFIIYIYTYLSEIQQISRKIFDIGIIYNVCGFIMTIFGCFSGALFTIEEGIYVEAPMYIVYMAANTLSLVSVSLIIILNAKKLGKRDTLVAFAYIYIPLIEISINGFLPEFSMFYPASTISVVILFILLQSDHVSELIRSRQELYRVATHDNLTGLMNRQAFFELNSGNDPNSILGVIFCDANALKYTNDKYGHEEGDKLLCHIAECFKATFRASDVYRISGDEFVVLFPHGDQEIFVHRVAQLIERFRDNEFQLASVGYAFGEKKDLDELLKEAEKNMYQDKQQFYAEYPMYRR